MNDVGEKERLFDTLLEKHKISSNTYAGFAGKPSNPERSMLTRNIQKYRDTDSDFEAPKSYNINYNVTKKVDNFLNKYTNKKVYYLYYNNRRKRLSTVRILDLIKEGGKYFIKFKYVETIFQNF